MRKEADLIFFFCRIILYFVDVLNLSCFVLALENTYIAVNITFFQSA